MLAHIMGIPVEETVLELAPAGVAMVTGVAIAGGQGRPAGRSDAATAAVRVKTSARSAAEEGLLDAAERLLVEVGYAGITTRRLAEEAESTTASSTTTSARSRTCSCGRSSASPSA